jgi:ribose transport system ATP-binding protein
MRFMKNEPFIEVKNINKSFPGVNALSDVSLKCYPGEIVGLIGENGAGKSTLMKILAGFFHPDEGEIFVRGRRVEIPHPSTAQNLGINMVYQDTKLVPDLRVMQNIWLGHEPCKKSGTIDFTQMKEKSRELLDKFGIEIDPKSFVRDLGIAQKQLIEIVKALSHVTELLILDEPTSSLTPGEAQKLFEILKELKANGISILFISHRLSEVLEICDRFVVLRDGKVSGKIGRAEATEDALIKYMVGRGIENFFNVRDSSYRPGEVALETRNLSSGTDFSGINIRARRGEVLGIFGIQGNGQRKIVRTLAGLRDDYSGVISLDGSEVPIETPSDAIGAGISYLTNERREEGLFLPLSIKNNISIQNIDNLSRFGFIDERREKTDVEKTAELFNIKCSSVHQNVEQLSGGNQQKVAFAGNYLQKPKVFIFDDPTVGIDIKSKSEIYQFLKDLADKGAAVIVLSSDIIEILSISDRLLVVSKGSITGEFSHTEATEENVMNAAVAGKGALQAESEQASGPRLRNRISNYMGPIIVTAIVLALGVLGTVKSDFFLSSYNLSNIALQLVPLALAALGQSLVILTGGIDLSVGPLISLITAIASYTIVGESYLLGILLCLGVGLTVGLVNGLIISKLKLPDIIVTLATYTAVMGITLIVRPTGGGNIAGGFMKFVTTKFFQYIPAMTLLTLLFYFITEFGMQKTRRGTYVYASGSNREAAYIAGIKVERVKIAVYVLCSVVTAFAGLIVAGRIGSGDPRVGTEFTMASITAVIVGGIAITGGRGFVGSSFLGALMIILMQNILNMMQISAYFQYVWIGLLMIVAVGLYQLPYITQGKKKRKR